MDQNEKQNKMANGKQKNGNEKKPKKKIKPWSSKKKSVSEEVIIGKLRSQYKRIDPKKLKYFKDFPLSDATQQGLKDHGFTEPTEIQRESIGLSLKGQDILGAAKTGSGKTLAFLIPVLEILYCKRWTRLDGTGALIITPTRELAYQIFETLRKVGAHHDFSAGLIIGGKDLKFEKSRMDQVNIIICTPGRLLQHMDENPLLDCVNLKVLVLDEADRILDLGFKQAMNSIIENLPSERQTLLFSATQTKSVQDLARLSLKDPMYVSVHEHAAHSTPESLAQSYLVCELEDKITVLFSFIRNHLKHKVIVFMSSCKQVKYMYEAFTQLRPGVPLLALYGTLHQMKRMAIYEDFCRKAKVVMFATDIAARGLDFPAVNWVVQLDCPEDADTYIHRAGRTARLQRCGESLLILLPSEKDAMLKRLEDRKIPIKEIQVNPEKLQNPARKLESFLAQSPELKESAQRAFVSYAKSVFLMKDKEVFNIQALDTDAYARSLGLAIPPRIRFLQRKMKEEEKQRNMKNEKNSSKTKNDNLVESIKYNNSTNKSVGSDDSDESDESDKSDKSAESAEESEDGSDGSNQNIKIQGKQGHKVQKTASEGFNFGSDDSEDDDVLKLKRRNHELAGDIAPLTEEELKRPESKKKNQPLTKAAVAKKFLRKKIQLNKKVEFNEEGEVVLDPKSQKVSALAQEYDAEDVGGIDIEKAKAVMKEEDLIDKQKFRERIRAKHREEKRKAKLQKQEEEEVQDDFSSDESSGPDLSWLPDPDNVYGPKKSDDEDDTPPSDDLRNSQPNKKRTSYAGDDGSESDEESSPPPSRSKRKSKKQGGKEGKKVRHEEEESYAILDTGLSLHEDEELAMKFLRASRS